MKLYLVTSSNSKDYGDYREVSEILIGRSEIDINNQVKKSMRHFQEDIYIEEISSIYGYNIKLEKQDEVLGKIAYFDVIIGLEVMENSGEIIDISYDAYVQELEYTILTKCGEILKLNELEIKCII